MKLKFLTSKYTIYCCLCRRFIEVHGRPSNLSFYYSEHLSSPHYYQVKWSTTSYYMVDLFTLLYRKVKFMIYKMFKKSNYVKVDGLDEAVEWITVKIPGTGHHETVQDNSWILTNLSSASSYECIVQACLSFSSLILHILYRHRICMVGVILVLYLSFILHMSWKKVNYWFFYFTKLQRKYFLFPGQSFKQNWGNSQLMANNAQIYDCFSATHTIIISLVQFNMIHLISD